MALSRSRFLSLSFLLIALPVVLLANPIGTPGGGGSSIEWQITASGYEKVQLIVSGPDGEIYFKEFNGARASFRLLDLGDEILDGQYNYELRTVPRIPADVRKKLDAARAAGDAKAAKKALEAAGITPGMAQSGAFTILGGSIVSPTGTESDANDQSTGRRVTTDAKDPSDLGPVGGGARPPLTPRVDDVVFADDVIITGSLCVGFDCVDGEAFGFDTIKMKENNTRVKFEDTSTSTGFPTTDWQLTANDSASGGANKFSIEDTTNAKVPFTITGNAPTNSMFVDSTGRLGLRTSTPVLDVHVSTTNTPAHRLEQTSAGGFTAQTWDIAGNEANFFIRDVTGGSRLPFRIRPGAPTSSIDIAATGRVGVGTASPQANVDIRGTNAHVLVGSATADFIGSLQTGYGASNGTEQLFFAVQSGLAFMGSVSATNLGLVTNNSTKVTIDTAGNVGFNLTTPSHPIHHSSGAHLTAGGTWTSVSSREAKLNIDELPADEAFRALDDLKPVTFAYKADPNDAQVGFIAEEVPDIVAQPDRKTLNSMDIVAVLTKVVKEQQKTIDELAKKVDELQKNN